MRKTKRWTEVLGPALANVSIQGENSLISDGSYRGCNVSFFAVTDGKGGIATLQVL